MNATVQSEVPAQTREAPAAPKRPRPVHRPRVDVLETPGEFRIAADVPGVPMSGIDLRVEGDRLTLSATHEQATPDDGGATFRQRRTGDYRRSFTLPDGVDRAGIRADLRDGVLRITLPKLHAAEPHRVQIEAR